MSNINNKHIKIHIDSDDIAKDDISKKVNTIITKKSPDVETTEDSNLMIIQYLNSLEKIIDELPQLNFNDDSENDDNKKIIQDFENKYSSVLEEVEYIISSSEDTGTNKLTGYNTLQNNYYKIKNYILNVKSEMLNKQIENMSLQLENINKVTSNISSSFEGIGSTILSTVVSLTVVVTAITAIEKIESRFIPLYLVSMVWLGMTFIIFINNLFNKNDFNSKQATFLYGAICVLEFILLFATCVYK